MFQAFGTKSRNLEAQGPKVGYNRTLDQRFFLSPQTLGKAVNLSCGLAICSF